ncbi:dihydroxyacetone kinase phosphoryl donor subunit DhaM [Paludifilum halophilum]|uniref:phosphoenolpyruvate--glycerone phosphotransferase n=1 Tax=Paludifilum halophilum TaxID=1642702 RepID=A0A235B1Q4_9BACL|nr:dihydroxyacetone kinase phosphoryl donor subunit DhaM [Paludifilum halophilum]OYD06161.1 hypothetical protein CHM34_17845 [Paludifilum halophilum]
MASNSVALLLVSHSESLARGTRELIAAMAREVTIRIAAGDGEGGLGTSAEGIETAVRETDAEEVLIFFDLGSALMHAEMAVEMWDVDHRKLTIVDAPFVEGALAAAMAVQTGQSAEAAVQAAEKTRREPKRR